MNILLVTEYFPDERQPVFFGGVQARTFFVAEKLKKNHALEVMSIGKGNSEATTASLLPRFRSALSIIRRIPKKQPDIIEASNVAVYLPSFLLAKRLKVPVVAWIPDILGESWKENFAPAVARAGNLLEKITVKLPWDRVIAMSKATKRKLIQEGVKDSRITVIYGGVDHHWLSSLRKRKFSNPTVCSIARLLPYKRLVDLIKAIAILKPKIPNLACLIIGQGPEEDRLKRQIRRLRLKRQVKLLGNMPYKKAMQFLSRSHVFCLPSVTEGFGIVTVEAMAAGVPYVNARIPQTEEITENGKGGILVEPKHPESYARGIQKLIEDPKLYQRKREEGQKLSERYDWSIIARQTERVYKKASKINI